MHAHASVSSVCYLALREMRDIVIIHHDFTAENQDRECIGLYKYAYPTIIVNGGGYEQQRVDI